MPQCTHQKERETMKYGLQMYSVRDITKDDLLGAIEKVGALGYHYAEFAGFFDVPA